MISRKITMSILLLAALLSVPSASILGEDPSDKLTIGGEVRYRAEGDARDFDCETVPSSFHLLRTRLNLDFFSASDARVYLQLQDSRVLGSPSSGDLRNDTNLGVHQAFVELDSWLLKGLYHRLGRFEYVKGNQRLLGNVGWSNVGRTWDGVVTGFRCCDFNAEAFLLKNEEGDPYLNDDKDLFGIYAHDPAFDLFLLYERDNYRTSEARRQDRFTLGGYSARSFAQVDYIANLAYQFGKTNFDSLDLSAYLLTLEVGYAVPLSRPLRLAAGFDIASGDDDPVDGKVKSFDNLYYTGHKFRGHMDYFVASTFYGLNDYLLRLQFSPVISWQLKGDFHIFRANKTFASLVDGRGARGLGTEIDLYATYLRDRATVDAGVSAFLPSDDWRGENADPGYWSYVQIAVGF